MEKKEFWKPKDGDAVKIRLLPRMPKFGEDRKTYPFPAMPPLTDKERLKKKFNTDFGKCETCGSENTICQLLRNQHEYQSQKKSGVCNNWYSDK